MNKLTTIKLFFAIAISIIFNSFFIIPVSAHVLKTDGSIGAVMHVDPEDEPFAGRQSGFFFEFKDTQGKFKPADCDCTFSISEGEKQIFSQPLFSTNTSPSLTSASVFFTFPQKDVYEVKVTGKPYSGASFQPFNLVYDVRVDREAGNVDNSTNISGNSFDQWLQAHVVHVAAIGLIVIFFAFAIVKSNTQKKRR